MLDEEYYRPKTGLGTRITEWIGLPDAKAGAVLAGCLLFIVLVLVVLPPWLRARTADDLRGVAPQMAPGIISVVQISPVSEGGASLFNGVDVEFAGKTGYYALPRGSQWKPAYHDTVTVTYRVGRHSGLVHVDDVEPAARGK